MQIIRDVVRCCPWRNQGALWLSLVEMVVTADTKLLRFCFGMLTILHTFFVLFGAPTLDHMFWEHDARYNPLPAYVWALGLVVSSGFMIFGSLTGIHGRTMMVFEGVLGAACWIALLMIILLYQGAINTSLANLEICIAISGTIASSYLLIRYPTWQGEVL